MWLRLIVAFTCVLLATPSFAHGADQHVLGTIMVIDSNHVVVKTSKGQAVDVRINKKTLYKDGRNPKEANVPDVGDRVVIKATKDGKVLLATEIHFSAAKRVPAPIPPAPVN
jgi:flagellar hook assembly protein FlgD